MREKQLQTVVTFPTTAASMAMEQYCKEHNIAGRLIPVPGQIRAGCGLAWLAPITEKQRLQAELPESGLVWEEISEYRL